MTLVITISLWRALMHCQTWSCWQCSESIYCKNSCSCKLCRKIGLISIIIFLFNFLHMKKSAISFNVLVLQKLSKLREKYDMIKIFRKWFPKPMFRNKPVNKVSKCDIFVQILNFGSIVSHSAQRCILPVSFPADLLLWQ